MKLPFAKQIKKIKYLKHFPDRFYDAAPHIVAVDTETTGLRWSQNDRVFTIGCVFDWWDGERYRVYNSWNIDPKTRLPDYKGQKGLNIWRNWVWCNPRIDKVLANAKYDWHMMEASWGPLFGEPKGKVHDVLLAAWCCNTLEPTYKLEALATKYLNNARMDAKHLRELTIKLRKLASRDGLRAGTGVSSIGEDYWLLKHYNQEKLLRKYNIEDCENTLDLWNFYSEGMKQLEVRETYDREIELLQILYKMESRGIRFFEDDALETIDEINLKNGKLYVDLQIMAQNYLGRIININSPKQLQELIYSKQGFNLPIIRRTDPSKQFPKGQPKTDSHTLQEYLDPNFGNVKQDHRDFIDKYLQYVGNEKGKGFCKDYIDKSSLDENVIVGDLYNLHKHKAMHTSFNQLYSDADRENKTRTGRLSSSGPNLHNVSKPETSAGYHVLDGRKFFGPRGGYVLYCIDYSQIELRIFAYRLGQINPNNKLYQAFLNGDDPHTTTSNAIDYLRNMADRKYARQLGKHSNFTVANCGGKNALYSQYNVPLNEGEQLIHGFYKANPEARTRQNEAANFAKRNGYIETITGRKINVDLSNNAQYAYRATSYDIQGSAADIIKIAMINWQNWKDTLPNIDAHLLLQVHDELVFEVWKSHTYKWFLKLTVNIMEGAAKKYIDMPILCEVEKSRNTWSEGDKEIIREKGEWLW